MKRLILIPFLAISALANPPQTNIYYTHVGPDPKTRITCAGTPFTWSNGHGNYIPKPLVPLGTNSWYFTDTNIFSLTFSNSLPVIQATSDFGPFVCGHGTLVITDAFYPDDHWRFELLWPTNLPLPNVNSNVPLTTFGVHTNEP